MSLSFILPNQSNIFSFKRNIFTEIFSSKNVEKIARESNALIRNRKLKINKYFISALSVLSNSPNSKIFTMQSIYDMYTSLASKENGEILTKKCVHKHLDNEEMVTCTGRMLEEVLKVISSITKQKFKKIVPKEVKLLLNQLKVNDIILIDGTEFNVQPSLSGDDDFKGSSKGRPHLDGEPPRPSVKLHVAFSVSKQTFEYIDITSGCESERAHVSTDKFENCLIIADRGYVSKDLEKKISESNNYFIIKGKSNTTGTIDAVYNTTSKLNHLTGKKLNEIKVDEAMDFDITSKYYCGSKKDLKNTSSIENNKTLSKDYKSSSCSSCFGTHKCRVIRGPHLTSKNKKIVVTLRTNLPRNNVNAEQILLLYRVRWAIEIFNKVCKSSNGLCSINSGKKNIIYEFIMLSLISTLIKTFFGYLTQIDYDIGLISIQKLNKRLANTNLLNFYKALIFYGKSKTYKIVKELLGIIALNCQREKPSTRDKEQLKDFPTLVYTINNFWNDPKNFFAKA